MGRGAQIEDVDFAYDAALLENQGYDQATELGVRSLAGEQIKAHGRVYSVAEAIIQCPPFAQAIQAVAESVPDEFRSSALSGMIGKMSATAQSVPDAVRVQDSPTAHREYVKKN